MNLDSTLLEFQGRPWTLRDSFSGTHIFGRNGAGKTRTSGWALAQAFLRAGYGGLVLTVKPEEANTWAEYLLDAGRPQDLVRVRPESHDRFNFLEYEAGRETRGGGITQNVTSLFFEAIDDQASRSADPYWDNNMLKLLGHAVDANLLAGGKKSLSLESLNKTIASAPTRRKGDWSSSFCVELLRKAWMRRADFDSDELDTYERAEDFFAGEFPDLPEKTRSIVKSCFTSKADQLLRAPHRTMFSTTGVDTFPPELSHGGKVIVLDIPVHQFRVAGLFAQRLYKTIWQRAAEGRKVESSKPLFLWCDEAHHFMTEADATFNTSAREYRVAGVYLSQNLPKYFNSFGARNPEPATLGFLGVLHTKIFHQNNEPKTNEWASSLWDEYDKPTTQEHRQSPPLAPAGGTIIDKTSPGGRNTTHGFERQRRVPPREFIKLQTPKPPDFLSDTIIYYSDGQDLRHPFPMKEPKPER